MTDGSVLNAWVCKGLQKEFVTNNYKIGNVQIVLLVKQK